MRGKKGGNGYCCGSPERDTLVELCSVNEGAGEGDGDDAADADEGVLLDRDGSLLGWSHIGLAGREGCDANGAFVVLRLLWREDVDEEAVELAALSRQYKAVLALPFGERKEALPLPLLACG